MAPTVAAPFGGSTLVAAGAGEAAIQLIQSIRAKSKVNKDEAIATRSLKSQM